MAARTGTWAVGLFCGGGLCLLGVALAYLGAEFDRLHPGLYPLAAGKVLAAGAVTVLGVILVSAGVVGGLLSLGVFTLPTNPPDDQRARSHARGGPSVAGEDATGWRDREGAVSPEGMPRPATTRERPSGAVAPSGVGDAYRPGPGVGDLRPEGVARSGDGISTPVAPGRPEAGLLPPHSVRKDGKRQPPETGAGGETPRELPVAAARDGEKRPEPPSTVVGAATLSSAADRRRSGAQAAAWSVASATTPSSVADAPAPEPQPSDLVEAWDVYRRTGDGHFKPYGLQSVLDERSIRAEVSGGDRIDAGGSVLIVETPSRRPHFYVLPSFAKSPRAVRDWFDDRGGGALTGRTQRVIQVGEGRWIEGGFQVVGKGVVA